MDIKTKDLLGAIQELSGKNDPSYQGNSFRSPFEERKNPIPENIAQHLATKDERGVGISILVSMSYTSMSGNVKDRDILIRRVVKSGKNFFIDGLATDIKMPRLIKVSDITQIRDMTSGRVYTDAKEFIEKRLGIPLSNGVESTPTAQQNEPQKSDFQKVIERTAPAMTVLTFLSSIDGVRRPAERAEIVKHVRSRTTDLNYADTELEEYLIALAPDLESFKMALQVVLSKDKKVVQSVVQAMLAVITADGKVEDKERAFLSRIISILEQEGFEFNLSF